MVCSLLNHSWIPWVFHFSAIQLGQLQIWSACMFRNEFYSLYLQQCQGMCLANLYPSEIWLSALKNSNSKPSRVQTSQVLWNSPTRIQSEIQVAQMANVIRPFSNSFQANVWAWHWRLLTLKKPYQLSEDTCVCVYMHLAWPWPSFSAGCFVSTLILVAMLIA